MSILKRENVFGDSKVADDHFREENELAVKAPSVGMAQGAVALVILYYFSSDSPTVTNICYAILFFSFWRIVWGLVWPVMRQRDMSRSWNAVFNFIAIFKGVLWGAIGPVNIFEKGPGALMTAIGVVCMVGVVAGSLVGLGIRPWVYRSFITVTILPVVLLAAVPGVYHGQEYALAVLHFLYLAYMWKVGIITYQKYVFAVNQTEIFNSIIQSLPFAITCRDMDQQHRFTLINPAAERIYQLPQRAVGLPPEEVLPTGVASQIVQDDETFLSNNKVKVFAEEKEYQFTDTPKQIHSTRVLLRENRLILDLSEDVTEKRKNEQKIQELQVMREHSSKMAALGEMAGGMAHEINNPLFIIHGYIRQLATLVQKEGGASKDMILNRLQKADAAVFRVQNIVSSLRLFSKDAAGESIIKNRVNEIVKNAVSLCIEKFKSQGVEIEIAGAEDVQVLCRPTQVSQVLVSLLNNAYDAVLEAPERKIRIEWSETETHSCISVVDSGTGIPDQIKDKIFAPFFTTKRVGAGSGLGLSVSKGILDSHNGNIELNSRPGRTEFKLIFPKRLTSEKTTEKIAG